ncbi:hypothetical protein, variant [Verruconis gallopava]|uniref:Zn(2)-C6 fungal-type domain-containing protein n=1 Tax=Verruconis gallopava TaxID=253628 RepID=A0A0D2AKW2_9PEZI|nr:hypothetical protein, variant [Verruconis gallopava]KIW07185.1 hypothetical protein, variant [Verruconis gallopava]
MEDFGGNKREQAPINPQPEPRPPHPDFHSDSKVKKKTRASRQQVAVACLPCQKRKCRCDGKRPVCSTCVTRGKDCEYNIDEGMSRVAHLKEKNKTLEETSKELQAVIEILRKGSDSDAAAVLARLRVGHSIASILKEAETNASSSRSTQDSPKERRSDLRRGLEIDIRTEIPSVLKNSKIFNRDDWTRLGQSRGATTFLYSSGRKHSSQGKQATWSRSSATSHSANNPQSQAPATAHRSPPLMIQYNEAGALGDVKLHNFGNLDFSSGIRANNYPSSIQNQQVSNLFTPQWAKMIVPIMLPEGHPMKAMHDSMLDMWSEGRRLLQGGASLHSIAGSHPQLSAILNDQDYERAPILSQWASRLVYSIKESNRYFVCYASMYVFWWVMRWMIAPSPETYSAIPEVLRPSPTQLFMPHLLPIEFFSWPGLRDYLVRVPEKFEEWEWMLDMSQNVASLACVSDVDKWSVKPSFRQYFMDADKYMRIRWDDE